VLLDHHTVAQQPSTSYEEHPDLKLASRDYSRDDASTNHSDASVESAQLCVAEIDSPGYRSKESIKIPDRPLGSEYHRAVIKGPGSIEELEIEASAVRELGATASSIAVRACSLNFGDLLCVKGLYPTMPAYPFTPGLR